MTTLVLTPDFDDKTLVVSGKVCVGEKVDVTVIGVTEPQSINLRVRFRYDSKTVAIYPTVDGDVWEHSGSSASASMDLNVDVFRALYEGFEDRDKLSCVIIVDNPDDQNMYSSAKISVGNWPAEAGSDVPYSLSTYKDDVAELRAGVLALDQSVSATNSALGTHLHDGGTTVKLEHSGLNGIGTSTHDQIDAALTAVTASLGTIAGEATGLRNDLNDIKAVCQTVKTMPVSTAKEREARVAFLIQGLIDSL